MAEAWIGTHQERLEKGESALFAITLREGGLLVGSIGLELRPEHQRGEVGFWVGKPYWNQGYCTEAAREVLRYGFISLRLRRIYAFHFGRNPASGRVMQKIGMTYEGTLRQHFIKWGVCEDLVCYGILREEFEGNGTP